MKSWLRQTLPPGWVIAAFFSGYLVTWLPILFFLALDGTLRNAPPETPAPGVFLAFSAFCYGVFRVAAFHPACRHSYTDWLLTTPWTSARPLPLGSVYPTPQDLLVVLLLNLMWWPHCFEQPWLLATLFLVGYLLALTYSFYAARLPNYLTMMAIGLGWVARFYHQPHAAFVATLICLPVALLGLQRTLREFPQMGYGYRERTTFFKQRVDCGFPYELLQDQRDCPAVNAWTGFVASLLVAWWSLVLITCHVEAGPSRTPGATEQQILFEAQNLSLSALALLGGSLVFRRIYLYLVGYSPPISVAGRVMTGRLMIPGYDKVFVAPLAILLVLIGFFYSRGWFIPQVGFPLASGLMTLAALNLGPNLRQWRLTCPCRLTPGRFSNKALYVQV